VQSTVGKGTTIQLRLPLQRMSGTHSAPRCEQSIGLPRSSTPSNFTQIHHPYRSAMTATCAIRDIQFCQDGAHIVRTVPCDRCSRQWSRRWSDRAQKAQHLALSLKTSATEISECAGGVSRSDDQGMEINCAESELCLSHRTADRQHHHHARCSQTAAPYPTWRAVRTVIV